ncbi:hypothetical protein GCM10027212_23790 [Actinotalea caeni]
MAVSSTRMSTNTASVADGSKAKKPALTALASAQSMQSATARRPQEGGWPWLLASWSVTGQPYGRAGGGCVTRPTHNDNAGVTAAP